MEAKNKKLQSTSTSSQVNIIVKENSKVDFSSHTIKEQLIEVKSEVKEVLDGANIDQKKLSLNFTV